MNIKRINRGKAKVEVRLMGDKVSPARWLEQAKCDLDDARFTFSGHKNNLTCYLCQQGSVKALKAYIMHLTGSGVWGTHVDELCKKANALDNRFEENVDAWKKLDEYYSSTRYPTDDDTPEFVTMQDAEEALKTASEVIEFVENLMGKTEKDL